MAGLQEWVYKPVADLLSDDSAYRILARDMRRDVGAADSVANGTAWPSALLERMHEPTGHEASYSPRTVVPLIE